MMANGWAQDGAVQDQIDDTIADAVASVRQNMASGEGSQCCEDCGDEIAQARREALPSARTCIACQAIRDKATRPAGINRRGSKDSQLR